MSTLEFEYTTIAFPYEQDIVSSSKPVFEAVVAEIEEDKRPASTDSAGLLLETTTGMFSSDPNNRGLRINV